jgi:hypothetical protein
LRDANWTVDDAGRAAFVSAKERRIRRQRHPEARPAPPEPATGVARALRPLPQWRWRTFPVFCALSIGLFIGVYAGWFAGFIAADQDDQTLTTVVFIVAALFLGFSLSRLTTRFIVSRNWIKPRRKS